MFIALYNGVVVSDDSGAVAIQETLRDALAAITEYMYHRPDWSLVTIYKLRKVVLDGEAG